MPAPLFAQAVLEKAALDSAAAGAGQMSYDLMDSLRDGRIVVWLLVAAVVFMIFKTFRRSPQ
jgi:hypothetical protein